MSGTRSVAALLILAAAVGCSSDASGPPPETVLKLTIVSGDAQAAGPQQTVPLPLVVQVNTASGEPLTGYVVTWTASGGGEIVPSSPATNTAGKAQAQWTLGYTGAQEAEARIYYSQSGALWPISAKFTATLTQPQPTTQKPAILHYDGATWTVVYQPLAVGAVSILSIWGSSPSSIFAVGEYCGVEAMIRYDGASWTPASPDGPPGCSGFGPIVRNITGSSATNIFRVESGGTPPTVGSYVVRFDGANWSNSYARTCVLGTSGCPSPLAAVWTDSPTNAFVVGDAGFIAHYDGNSWTPQATGTSATLMAVWGVAGAATPRVFAVGSTGTILMYDGTSWQPQVSGTTQTLRAVWGSSATDVFGVGDGGVILHYDGANWSAQNSTGQRLYGVWGTGPTSVFAVGDGPTVLYYDGTSWSSKAPNVPIDLHAVWGTSPTNVYVGGLGR